MKKLLTALLLSASLLLPMSSAMSADFTYDAKDKAVVMSGPILEGDGDKFIKIYNQNKSSVKVVILDTSPGGLVYEAGKIIDTVMKNDLNTYAREVCISSCALIWLSGKKMYVNKDTFLGAHSIATLSEPPSAKNPHPTSSIDPESMAENGAILARMGFPDSFIFGYVKNIDLKDNKIFDLQKYAEDFGVILLNWPVQPDKKLPENL